LSFSREKGLLIIYEVRYKVEFYTLQALLKKLYATIADDTTDDTTDDTIAKLACLDLLIIDQVGYIRSKPEYPSLFLDLVTRKEGWMTPLFIPGKEL